MKRWWMLAAVVVLALWIPLMREHSGEVAAVRSEADSRRTTKSPAAATKPDAPAAQTPAQDSTAATSAAAAVAANASPNTAAAATPTGAAAVPDSRAALLKPNKSHATPEQIMAGSAGKMLGHAFDQQQTDPAWSPGAEASIRREFMRAQVPAHELLALECRESLCKLQLQYNIRDRERFRAAYAALRKQFGSDMGLDAVAPVNAHGTQLMRVYMLRQGASLADFRQ